ncbi:aminopeptidase [Caenimonas koreensis DSM 17982]|uniref:Aminopeptidase n=1 Tax=Caenimonas koreensis DSM 17982 TaxID=1121255 RepID=A0A844AXS8_9BURK|nr:aminopeptidase [Caenimonas koreensis]MRD47208.1 aminopeptidase [Caenimonas koreensis DSM 17982]
MAIGGVSALAVAAASALCLTGCANMGYYWQSVNGHLSMMSAAKPVQDWLDDPAAPARLKERLALSQRIRTYAVTELKLPDNPSYRRYADLHRNAVVWNVVAAPPYSTTLRQWCFPVTGCVGYRGYFDEKAAKREAAQVASEGFETAVYPVPAYSTLGWMNWAGGDPLLNTFIYYPEGQLARTIFHELAHQVAYAKDDTTFNESFATSVERLGGGQWLAMQATEAMRQDYAQYNGRRIQFRELTLDTRKRLAHLYESESGDRREALKQAAMAEFRAQYAKLRDSWGGDAARFRGYDQWVARANNASFGTQAAYDELVPAFEALFEREGRDFRRFYDSVKHLAALPSKEERRRALKMQN